MAGYATSESTGSSQSSSTPVVEQSPQSLFGLQLAQLLSALGQYTYNWAGQQFDNGMGVTDQNINQYLQGVGQAMGFANNLLGRYTSVVEPLMNQYIAQAGSYSSAARQAFMAGQAESTVAQADQAAMDSAQRNLQGFGINPNSGRYQDLLLAQRTQDAAARAGAGTQAALNTANTGRAMTQTALQMGQNVPGFAANALNSAFTGLSGAENALLGMLNTGANLKNVASNLFNAAGAANRLPPVGQQSSGSSQQQSSSKKEDPTQPKQQAQPKQPGEGTGAGAGGSKGGGYKGGGGGGGGNGREPGGGFVPSKQQGQDDGSGQYTLGGMQAPGGIPLADLPSWLNNPVANGGSINTLDNATPQNANWADPNGPAQLPALGPMQGKPNSQDAITTSQQMPFGLNNNGPSMFNQKLGDYAQPQSAVNNEFQSLGNTQNQWNGDLSGQAGINDIGSNLGQFQDQAQGSGADTSSPWGDFFSTPAYGGDMPSGAGEQFPGDQLSQQAGINDIGSNLSQFDQGQGGGGQYGGQYAAPQDQVSSDFQSQADTQAQWDQGSSGGYGYASGGNVRSRGLPTSGGFVPRSASPSGGRKTDDINARLNAEEYVIPQDVTHHRGTKFFDDLVKKSRMARTGMAGPRPKGKPKPALPGPPTFTSHYLGGRNGR